jgi:hypothetical protein
MLSSTQTSEDRMDVEKVRELQKLLESKATLVAGLLSDREFKAAKPHMQELARTFDRFDRDEFRKREGLGIGTRFLHFQNAIQSHVELRASEGKRPSERSVNEMVLAVKRIADQSVELLEAHAKKMKVTSAEDDEEEDKPADTTWTGLPEFELRKFNEKREDILRALHRHGYLLTKAPVALVTHPAIQLEKAKKFFNIEALDGYPILHDQVVIGLDGSYIKTFMAKRAESKEFNKVQDVFNHFADLVKEKYASKNYTVVGRSALWPRTGVQKVSWLWLMPQRDFNLLRSCSFGSGLVIKNWGLAFSEI